MYFHVTQNFTMFSFFFPVPTESDMEGFDTRFEDIVSHHTIEGRSFFDDLRQLEFEEKAPI